MHFYKKSEITDKSKRIKKIIKRIVFISAIVYVTGDIIIEKTDLLTDQSGFVSRSVSTEECIFDVIIETKEEENKYNYLDTIIRNKIILNQLFYFSKKYDLDPLLFASLIKNESEFNPNSVNFNINGSVDRGLCQLNNFSFPELTTEEFYNTAINLENGAKYLRWCLDLSEDNLVTALASYNSGLGSVNNRRVGRSTLIYINKILEYKNQAERIIASNNINSGKVLFAFNKQR